MNVFAMHFETVNTHRLMLNQSMLESAALPRFTSIHDTILGAIEAGKRAVNEQVGEGWWSDPCWLESGEVIYRKVDIDTSGGGIVLACVVVQTVELKS